MRRWMPQLAIKLIRGRRKGRESKVACYLCCAAALTRASRPTALSRYDWIGLGGASLGKWYSVELCDLAKNLAAARDDLAGLTHCTTKKSSSGLPDFGVSSFLCWADL
ncbi:hypothetical protein PC112_g21700 [Phytophthora cactorum]|nr:hypothetical protein PC112_g21700 [Phytophthora cactorum]